MIRILRFMLLLALCGAAAQARASDVADSVGASQMWDAQIIQVAAAVLNNYGGRDFTDIGWHTSNAQLGVCHFNVDLGAVKLANPGHRLDSLIFYIYCTTVTGTNVTVAGIPTNTKWVEGTGSSAYQFGSCNWNVRGHGLAVDSTTIAQADSNWSTAGGDWNIANAEQTNTMSSVNQYYTWRFLSAADSFNAGKDNFSFVLKEPTHNSPGNTETCRFLTTENAGQKPYFIVYLTDTSAVAAVDFTQDANCIGAWVMNGPSCGWELDRSSGTADTLRPPSVANGFLRRSDDTPVDYFGASRTLGTYYLSTGNATALNLNGANQTMTTSAWVKVMTVPSSGTLETITGKYQAGGGGNRQWRLTITGTGAGKIKFGGTLSNDGTAQVDVFSTDTLYNDSTWYHVALVYDDTDIRLYVDGLLASTPTAHTSGIASKAAYFTIGSQHLGVGVMTNALIDEVGLFSRALSATEVLSLYTYGLAGDSAQSDFPLYTEFEAWTGDVPHDTLLYDFVNDSLQAICTEYSHDYVVLGQSVEGRDLGAMLIEPAEYGRTIMIIASLHGDNEGGNENYVSTVALGLCQYIAQNPGNQIRWIIAPLCNPDGVVGGSRENANGVNLNRNWDWNWELNPYGEGHYEWGGDSAFSEPESRALRDAFLTYQPHWFLDVHGASDQLIGLTGNTGNMSYSTEYLQTNGLGPFVRFNTTYTDSGGYAFGWAKENGAFESWAYETFYTNTDSLRAEEVQRLIAFVSKQSERFAGFYVAPPVPDSTSGISPFSALPFSVLPFSAKPYNQ